MDPLSDVLSLLKPRSYLAGGLDAGGDWSVQYPAYEGIKCYSVVAGSCWLTVNGVPEPVHMASGDSFLLPTGRPFRLSSDVLAEPIDARILYRNGGDGRIVVCNGGGDFLLVGGYFGLHGGNADFLLQLLPPIVHLHDESEKAALRWSVERMREELRETQPGGLLVVRHLAYMMLVQALRLQIAQGASHVGWLFALADEQTGAAIKAIHDDPSYRWTLRELAARAGMSRSTFALKFKSTVAMSPYEYLTRWRMLLATERLLNSKESIAVIAFALGYESESSFSTAFKRTIGCSPREYSRSARQAEDRAELSAIANESAREPVAS